MDLKSILAAQVPVFNTDTLLDSLLHLPQLKELLYRPCFIQRLKVSEEWAIDPGQNILDIGCGQGESCLVLAREGGPSAAVTGIDTCAPDYGTPPMKEAHAHIKASIYGPQINFLLEIDTKSHLPPSITPKYNAVTLSMSIWYFASINHVFDIFITLARASIPKIYLSEYSYRASHPSQVPHILAARAFARFHKYRSQKGLKSCSYGPRIYNIRAAPEPAEVVEAAARAGYAVKRQGYITPEQLDMDGHMQVRHVIRDVSLPESFKNMVTEEGLPADQEAEILALVKQVKVEKDKLDKQDIELCRPMDIWWVEFELKTKIEVVV